jgi:hypothetical protein
MQLYIEGMCTDEVDEWIFINGQKLLASGQEVNSTRSEWVPPVGGAPSRHTSTGGAAGNWGTQARPGGAPTQSSWASS